MRRLADAIFEAPTRVARGAEPQYHRGDARGAAVRLREFAATVDAIEPLIPADWRGYTFDEMRSAASARRLARDCGELSGRDSCEGADDTDRVMSLKLSNSMARMSNDETSSRVGRSSFPDGFRYLIN
jgi:hypothetical protein